MVWDTPKHVGKVWYRYALNIRWAFSWGSWRDVEYIKMHGVECFKMCCHCLRKWKCKFESLCKIEPLNSS